MNPTWVPGNKTANAMFGNAARCWWAISYSRAFQMMVGVQNMRVMQVPGRRHQRDRRRRSAAALNCHNADVEVEDYLRVIRYKTAKL